MLNTIADEHLLDSVKRVGEYLAQGLSTVDSALIAGIRGSGLWRAIALRDDSAGDVERAARERGLLVNAVQRNAIRLAPPLVLTENDVDDALPRLRDAFADAEAARP